MKKKGPLVSIPRTHKLIEGGKEQRDKLTERHGPGGYADANVEAGLGALVRH